jgi:hypothetical protein
MQTDTWGRETRVRGRGRERERERERARERGREREGGKVILTQMTPRWIRKGIKGKQH